MLSSEEFLRSLDYAKDDKVARERQQKTRFLDPFPEIDRALLNREDIARYVEQTAMVFPFDPERLKPASYEAQLGTEVLYWDDDAIKQHRTQLSSIQAITLRSNSITYVGLNVHFSLPIYIAVRFNLTITHVHRGLLLGTGPLVDPGYNGQLMIPIHNLTPNDYSIRPGDALVAIEFTKISANNRWIKPDDEQSVGSRLQLLKNVKEPDKTFGQFLDASLPANVTSVRSSLGATVRDAEKALAKVQSWNQNISLGAAIAVGLGLFSVYSLVDQTHQYVSATATRTSADIQQLDVAIRAITERTKALEQDVKEHVMITTKPAHGGKNHTSSSQGRKKNSSTNSNP